MEGIVTLFVDLVENLLQVFPDQQVVEEFQELTFIEDMPPVHLLSEKYFQLFQSKANHRPLVGVGLLEHLLDLVLLHVDVQLLQQAGELVEEEEPVLTLVRSHELVPQVHLVLLLVFYLHIRVSQKKSLNFGIFFLPQLLKG